MVRLLLRLAWKKGQTYRPGRTAQVNGRSMFLWPILQLYATDFCFQLALLWETWLLKAERGCRACKLIIFGAKISIAPWFPLPKILSIMSFVIHVCATSLISTPLQFFSHHHSDTSILRHPTVDLRESFPPKRNIRNVDPQPLKPSKTRFFKFHVLSFEMPKALLKKNRNLVVGHGHGHKAMGLAFRAEAMWT